MKQGLVGLAVAVAAVACVQRKPVATPVAQTVRPFDAGPVVTLVDPSQKGPVVRVQIGADITRDVMPTDDLAIIVSVGDSEVGRYPVVGKFELRPTRIKQEIELPLGDYEIDFEYKGERYAGMPFRLAEVPVWGGKRGMQLRAHPGTRLSLRERKLWVGRWWANDGPPQAWIVEWVREGQVVTMTSGREDRGMPTNGPRVVAAAATTFRDSKIVPNTIWFYGEEYAIPEQVVMQPGTWAARVVHGNSPPVAVVFNVLPLGKIEQMSNKRVASVGWETSWSKPLEVVALNPTEVERLNAKLPQISSNQPFDDAIQMDGPEPAVRLTPSSVRALFRSKQLAETWGAFVTLNTQTGYVAEQAAMPKESRRTGGRDKQEADRRTKLRTLRLQIEALIKVYGYPWKPEEFPRS